MATENTRHDTGYHRTKTPIKAAAVLLGIYIAMYLAVGGIVHVLTSPDAAAAIAPEGAMVPAAAATASTSPAGVGGSLPTDSPGQVSVRTDNSRECGPSAAIDSKCVFN